MAPVWSSTFPFALMIPSKRPPMVTVFPSIVPSIEECSPRMSVPVDMSVPLMEASRRNVPGTSSLPSRRTPFSRNPVHSPDSCDFRSNQERATKHISYIHRTILQSVDRTDAPNHYHYSIQKLAYQDVR